MTENSVMALTAINKWFYFCYNYNHATIINKVWGQKKPYLVDHLQSKLDYYRQRYGLSGAMNEFYASLDNENQIDLLNWVVTNYNGECKLKFE